MENCLFCKIVKGEIPANIIYEDDKIMAFHDINPVAPKHGLVIPKVHRDSLNEVQADDSALMGHMMSKIKEIAEAMGIAKTGYRVITNCGKDSGQEVAHLHFHVIGGRTLSKHAG